MIGATGTKTGCSRSLQFCKIHGEMERSPWFGTLFVLHILQVLEIWGICQAHWWGPQNLPEPLLLHKCVFTPALCVCVFVCKLVSCFHSILLEQIAETFSADLIFLFSPGHQGMIHKSSDKFTRYISFHPCSFAMYLTLNFGFQSHIFPFCCPNWLQVVWCYQSQHLSRWRS